MRRGAPDAHAREGFLQRVKGLGTAVKTLVVKEGATAKDWRAAADELGVSRMSPEDVEQAIESSAGGHRRTSSEH